MKRYVNGVETDLAASADVRITPLTDRLVIHTAEGAYSAAIARIGEAVHVSYRGQVFVVEKAVAARRSQSPASSGEIRATMPGQIVDVFVAEGDEVATGDKIVVLEAMKTQQSFLAPFAGVVKTVGIAKGLQVDDGQLLALIEAR